MKRRQWEFLISLCVLAACAALYKYALMAQLSPNLTGFTPRLLLAAAILALTAVFGRWYCRILCPAGTTQEIFSRIGAKLRLRRLGYFPRFVIMLILIPLLVGFTLNGWYFLTQLLDPVGMFGRLAMPLTQLIRYINGDGAFPASGQTMTLIIMGVGAVLLVVVPLFLGRVFCGICPMGTVLGMTAYLSGKTPDINWEKCVSCGQCVSVCPAYCINISAENKRSTPIHCFGCGECVQACKPGAIDMKKRDALPKERRSFLGSGVAFLIGLFCLSRPISSLLAKDSPTPQITPPGTGGDTPHRQHCIGCQACIPSCPMQIIQLNDNSALRPVLDYDLGFCHYNCRACLDSCPAGAFDDSLTLEQRQRIRVARVTLELPRCVVLLNTTGCGACAEVCPTHALQMVPQKDATGAPDPTKPTIPDFDPSYCIGCGACYHACPAEPRAFIVQGLAKHETAQGIRPSIAQEVEAPAHTLPEPGDFTDFPF